jgi:hypothetical protein
MCLKLSVNIKTEFVAKGVNKLTPEEKKRIVNRISRNINGWNVSIGDKSPDIYYQERLECLSLSGLNVIYEDD